MTEFSLGNLAVWSHPPKSESAKAVVLICHGLSEHSGRHLNTVHALNNAGFHCVRFDLRGSGKSGGRRQWVESFDDYVTDLNTVHNWILRQDLPRKLFLLGHSLGGAVAMHFAAQRSQELTGLILTAPAYIVGSTFPPIVIFLGRIAAKFLPILALPGNSDLSAVSRDPEVVKAFKEDPLSCHWNTVGQGVQILNALEHMETKAKQLQCPVLILHGEADKVIHPSGSQKLYDVIPSKDKEIVYFPNNFHELHNDLEKERVFQTMTKWLDGHLR